ncbi:MAG: hypothetical protein RLY86_1174 [Pseudomonadota bacterium]|jgi:probable phosphoglycerate mutase
MLTRRRFIFLRHGETDWNRERRMQGNTDTPLNATGLAQAAEAAMLLRGRGITTIVTSPLIRARTTAEIVGRSLGLDPIVVPDLREANWGPLEGQLRDHRFDAWRTDGLTPPGAERYADFIARALSGINTALALPAGPATGKAREAGEGPILIVAHGGVYWSVLAHSGLRRDSGLPNCRPILHEPPAETGHPWRALELTGL